MCEVMVNCENAVVPSSTANNGSRINAGLSIIDTLSEHWGVSVPVVIDNAESISKLIDMDTQVIR